MNEITLDKLDREILQRIQRDAGQSHAGLAEAVGTSAPSCWRRLRRLEEAGVLGPPVRLVTPQAIGLAVDVICNVRLQGHSQAHRQGFEAFAAGHPEVMECYAMSGEWDYLLRVIVRDVAAYERFLMRSLLQHPAVATASSHFALKQVKYTTALPLADAGT